MLESLLDLRILRFQKGVRDLSQSFQFRIRYIFTFILGLPYRSINYSLYNYISSQKSLAWRYFKRYFRNTSVSFSGPVCGGMKPRYSPLLPIR